MLRTRRTTSEEPVADEIFVDETGLCGATGTSSMEDDAGGQACRALAAMSVHSGVAGAVRPLASHGDDTVGEDIVEEDIAVP